MLFNSKVLAFDYMVSELCSKLPIFVDVVRIISTSLLYSGESGMGYLMLVVIA